MKRAMLILISMMLMTDQVSAWHAIGPGIAFSCGAWLEARKTPNGEAIQQEAWVTGYVSASNAFSVAAKQTDFLVGLDTPALFAWLDNYCRQHPLERLIAASDALIVDLTKKAASTGTKAK